MGHTRKILSSDSIKSSPVFCTNKLAIEVAENFHIHYRNYRLELDHVEFEIVARSFTEAYAKWQLLRKPESVQYKYKGDKNIFLSQSLLPALPSLLNSETNSNSTRVEIQQWADYIHFHYKDFRFEFSIDEFEEFSKVVCKGASKLSEFLLLDPSPHRVGNFHRTIPFDNIEKKPSNYWMTPDDINTSNVYESTYSESDSNILLGRETNSKGSYKVHVKDLFTTTLYHSSVHHQWGSDDNGVFIPLLNRYSFVEYAVANNLDLSDDMIKSTAYYELLCASIDTTPRDGQSNGVYVDPLKQARVFLELIKSLKEHGYDSNYGSIKGQKIEGQHGVEFEQQNPSNAPGIITFVVSSSSLKVQNGLHRLAILYYMYNNGMLSSPLIEVKHATGEPISPDGLLHTVNDQHGYPIGAVKQKKISSYMIRAINTVESKIIALIVLPFLILKKIIIKFS